LSSNIIVSENVQLTKKVYCFATVDMAQVIVQCLAKSASSHVQLQLSLRHTVDRVTWSTRQNQDSVLL
jgi:hypothetical protein